MQAVRGIVVSKAFSTSPRAAQYMIKDGSIWQLFVLCLLALGDTVPKCYVFLQFGTLLGKGKVAKWSAAPASILEGFNELYAVYGP